MRERTRSGRTNDSGGSRRLEKGEQRRGIVLLVVISLLALFILMGITFALVSSGYRDASKLEKEDQRVGDLPETEMDMILGQILYDSAARTSLQYHSLLRDLYGYDADANPTSLVYNTPKPEGRDTVRGQISRLMPNPFSGGNQLYTFGCVATSPPAGSSPTTLSPIPNYYAGRVITFTTGTALNHSTRIVASEWNQSLATMFVTIESIESKLAGPVTNQLAVGNQFVINGAPFNGSGAGLTYDSTNNNFEVNSKYQPFITPGIFPSQRVGTTGNPGDAIDVAFLPNYLTYANVPMFSPIAGGYPIDFGGLDESWDAPDLQNMFLAMVPPRVASDATLPIIPSFHRPELVNYIRAKNFAGGGSAYAFNTNITPTQFSQPNYQLQRDLLRSMLFRPMPWDHPNFSGSNPNFSPSYTVDKLLDALSGKNYNGTFTHVWDVDNDNDGRPDSVWIDPGLPVITSKDGRRYKRLAAILIKDLDGLVNVNAHGNLMQPQSSTYQASAALAAPMHPNYTAPPTDANGQTYALGLAQVGQYAPRGIGFGPAEVSFQNLFINDTNANSYKGVLLGRYLSVAETLATAVPGYINAANTRDALATIKHYGIPTDYANITGTAPPPNTANWFSSPPDTFGVSTIALDIGGQPIWANAGLTNEMRESPYELALSGESNNADTPYTAAELERLLRYHDPDAAQLPSRLIDAARNPPINSQSPGPSAFAPANESPGIVGQSQALRSAVSTISSSIPTPSLLIPRELRKALADYTNNNNSGLKLPGNATILDLYAYRLQNGGCPSNQIVDQMRKIVPWEFFKGQKFDINRWMGDGVNDGNGPVDDIAEAAGESAWPGTPLVTSSLPGSFLPQAGVSVRGQHTNTVPYNNASITGQNDNYFARQLYARHLFCLALALLPDTFQPTSAHEDGQSLSGFPTENTLTQIQNRRLVIRRLAQWAINCVDYRDPDSIMTAFEFDYNPWNGWQVDGNVGTDGGINSGPEYLPSGISQPGQYLGGPERDVVWGMEYPDLLITETLAFHDRRVKDTKYDSTTSDRSSTPPDDDVDQFRIPQGSLFVELYCPNSLRWGSFQQANQKKLYSQDLYDNNNHLKLGPGYTGGPAVWRLAISKLYRSDSTTDTTHKRSPEYSLFPTDSTDFSFLESASFDPADGSLITGTTNGGPLQIDRYAYLGQANTVPTMPDRSFYGSIANPTIEPGQYVVVGPRATTYLGSEALTNPLSPPLWLNNSSQRIQLGGATGISVNDLNGPSSRNPPDIRQPLGIICEMQNVTPTTIPGGNGPPQPWTKPAPWNIGLNVTEPLPAATTPPSNYYPEPLPPAGSLLNDAYDDPAAPSQNSFPDVPAEHPSSNPIYAANKGRPISDLSMTKSGTYNNCATVFLQRLADPTQQYNDVTNPYLTIDWATVDVTVFSGEEDSARPVGNPPVANVQVDPEDAPPAGPFRFRSRQRGFSDTNLPQTLYNPWSPISQNTTTTAMTGSNAYFKVNLSNDLNTTFNASIDRHTLGYLNQTIDELKNKIDTAYSAYPGEPNHPFPWLTWNNRPYSNAMELLNVPASSPSRAMFELTPGYMSYYVSPSAYGDPANQQMSGFRSPSANLLNFFYFDYNNQNQQMHLCRLLDFVEVPSPYAGAERWYNPKQGFGGYNNMNGQFTGITPPGFANPIFYRPPFNKLSRFRDPGRININTIFDGEIWNAALAQFPTIGDANYFNQVVAVSRKGTAGNWYAMDPNLPTRFANPFRAADSSDLMPTGFTKLPAEATLLRPDPYTGTPPSTRPLFHINQGNPVTQPQYQQWVTPPGVGYGGGTFRDIDRNPYFRHQALQKLGSVLTTQSNCFAVWITIGYFEVEEVVLPDQSGQPRTWNTMRPDQKAAWPDGLMLGQEIGADSGEITRHRAFYIIDRSIPVGFIPGSRLNTDDCVLVKRLIE